MFNMCIQNILLEPPPPSRKVLLINVRSKYRLATGWSTYSGVSNLRPHTTPLLVMGEQNSLNGSMVHRLPPLVCRPGHWPVAISLRSTFNDRESWTLHTEAYNAIDLSCLTGPARTSIDLLTRPSTDRVTVIGSRAFSVVSFKQWQVGPSPGGLRVQGPELQAKKNFLFLHSKN